MKTNTINLALYGDAENVERICGRFTSDFETKQKVEYTIADGLATITAIQPVIKTIINLPLPFVLPVNDLGSGQLVIINLDCDTLRAQTSICPTAQWANRRAAAPAFPGPRTEAFLTTGNRKPFSGTLY